MSAGIEFRKNPAYKNINTSMYFFVNDPVEDLVKSISKMEIESKVENNRVKTLVDLFENLNFSKNNESIVEEYYDY